MLDALHPGGAAGYRSGDDVGVAGERFGGAVDHHVVAHGDGILQYRRGKGVVDDGHELVFFCEGHRFVEVHEAQHGVGGRFDIENFRARR